MTLRYKLCLFAVKRFEDGLCRPFVSKYVYIKRAHGPREYHIARCVFHSVFCQSMLMTKAYINIGSVIDKHSALRLQCTCIEKQGGFQIRITYFYCDLFLLLHFEMAAVPLDDKNVHHNKRSVTLAVYR